jgi:hypothetical protein
VSSVQPVTVVLVVLELDEEDDDVVLVVVVLPPEPKTSKFWVQAAGSEAPRASRARAKNGERRTKEPPRAARAAKDLPRG